MTKVLSWLRGEPLAVDAFVGSLSTAGLAFDWPHSWTKPQWAAVIGIYTAFSKLVLRANVTPEAKAVEREQAAAATAVEATHAFLAGAQQEKAEARARRRGVPLAAPDEGQGE